MKKFFLFSIVILLAGCDNEKDKNQFYMPGQFEEQDAVWLGWQGYDPYYPAVSYTHLTLPTSDLV